MIRRTLLEVVLVLATTIALSWLIIGSLSLIDSADPLAAFFDQTPRILFGLLGIALGLWVILLIIGSIAHRRRQVSWRIATHIVSLAASLAITIGLVALLAMAAGGGADGWGTLVVLIGLGAGGVVLVSGSVAVVAVELFLVRRNRPVPLAAALPPESPATAG